MTPPQLGPALVRIQSTVEVPVTGDDLYLRDDTERRRVFAADKVVILYVQEYTETGDVVETITPWDVTAVVSGFIVTAGVPGKRRATRTFSQDPHADTLPQWPDWVGDAVERYHPRKRS
jgi:hypothetical protein